MTNNKPLKVQTKVSDWDLVKASKKMYLPVSAGICIIALTYIDYLILCLNATHSLALHNYQSEFSKFKISKIPKNTCFAADSRQ